MIEIPGFEDYLINENGDVYSLKVDRLLTPQINTRGYVFIRLHKDNIQYSFLLHRLLAFVFLDLPSLTSELEVDHKDTNKLNNKLNNLQVLTSEDHKLKTYGNHWNINRFCTVCNKKLYDYNVSGLCKTHYNESKINDGITLESIIYWVTNYSWIRASKELGLSDNGLRKRYTKLSGNKPKDIHSPVV